MADIQAMRNQFFQNKKADIDRNATARSQQESDVINRRMTSIGQAGSGAAIAAGVKAREGVEAQAQQARNDLSGQELQATVQEDQFGRQLAEAQKGRDFQAGESKVGREFAAGQNLLGQQFTEKMSDKDIGVKREFFNTEQGNKLRQMDLEDKRFEHDKETTEFNKRMAELEAGRKPPGLLDGLLPGVLPAKGTSERKAFDVQTTISSGGLNLLGGGGGGCFLSTATVDAMGMDDDSWVLTEARRFRDTYMAATPERSEEIVRYYETAPKIVEEINSRDDAASVWKRLFWRHIVPFATEVRRENMARAHELYSAMIEKTKELVGGK